MREYFTYGSVRGAAGNGGPYRVRLRLKYLRAKNVETRYSERDGAKKGVP